MKTLIGILFIVSIVVEYYSYQAIKTLTSNRTIRRIWVSISIGALLLILVWSLLVDRNNRGQVQFLMGLFMIVYVPKLVLASTLLLEDIFRLIIYLFRKLFSSRAYTPNNPPNTKYFPSRRKAISTIGLGVASIPFLSIIEGVSWGKFDFRVKKATIYFPDLPDAFDGYKIAQISDAHVGSFNLKDRDKVARGIELLNNENADLFVFTGDLVNNYAEEMDPWISTFKNVKAKDGKYSILGNHDYGIYAFGLENIASQQKNIQKLQKHYDKLEWKLLRNESIKIEKEGQFINLIGVENWGSFNFPKFGNLTLASEKVENSDFNILLSHDPSHFDAEVKTFPKKMSLSLAGHTHGMQFGIEIPGVIKWSPIRFRYPKWAGLYEDMGKYLYVNRGFGYIGFPGRVGIWPEITLIELKKG